MMSSSSDIASSAGLEQNYDMERARRAADRLYQGLTIAAMLMLLGSLWVF
jgi:hypothetical protein